MALAGIELATQVYKADALTTQPSLKFCKYGSPLFFMVLKFLKKGKSSFFNAKYSSSNEEVFFSTNHRCFVYA